MHRNPERYREWARAYRAKPERREAKRASDRARSARQRAEQIEALVQEGRCCKQCGERISIERLIGYSGVRYCTDQCRRAWAYQSSVARKQPAPVVEVKPLPKPVPRPKPAVVDDEDAKFERRWAQLIQEGRVCQ